jgi:hypothetical protein
VVLERGRGGLLFHREKVPVTVDNEPTAVFVADNRGDHGDMDASSGHQRDERVPQVVKTTPV